MQSINSSAHQGATRGCDVQHAGVALVRPWVYVVWMGAIFPCTGFAGTSRGSFFASPGWVDEKKPPGHTSQAASYCPTPHWWATAYSGYSLFFSPNLVWLCIALLTYLLAPYDLDAAAHGWAWSWVMKRALVNTTLVFGYAGFWHVSLYGLGWSKRPFNPQRVYQWDKVLHNAFYTLLACLQWTAWEALMMRSWATGRLPYLTDAEAFGTRDGMVNLVASCFWVPLWRSWHFYFAHRFLHVRPLYKYVHSLHHRNTDIEPFAGLCMHPIEHMYYFACCGPSLYLFASPFAFMWNGVHLLISPAASHSGFEDHFQSDQFHYLHHKFFECNYGPSDCPLDRWFGTFRDKMDTRSDVKVDGTPGARQSADQRPCDEKRAAARVDAKATLLGPPDAPYVIYLSLAAIVPALTLVCALRTPSILAASPAVAPAIAALVAGGPVATAVLLIALSDARKFCARSPRSRLNAALILYPPPLHDAVDRDLCARSGSAQAGALCTFPQGAPPRRPRPPSRLCERIHPVPSLPRGPHVPRPAGCRRLLHASGRLLRRSLLCV